MILPTASDLADYPGLITWLTNDSWKNDLSAKFNYSSSSPLILESITLEDTSDLLDADADLTIDATFKRDHRANVRTNIYVYFTYDPLTRNNDFECFSECTCENRSACLHPFTVFEELKRIATGQPETIKKVLSPDLAAWLRKMKTVSSFSTTPDAPTTPAKPYNKFLAYCIESNISDYTGESNLTFTLRPATTKKIGFTIDASTAAADPLKPSRYMADEDTPICAAFHRRNRKRNHWGSEVDLRGDDWLDILVPALASKRLFYGRRNPINTRKKDYVRLEEGPPRNIETAWRILDDGSAMPILDIEDALAEIIYVDSLFYIDTEKQHFGRLTSQHPASILKAWAYGPVIPANDIGALNQELATILPENPLPLPKDKPAQIISAPTPVPTLYITEVHAGVFQKRHIGGTITIQYADRPPLLPIAPDASTQVSWVEDGQRYILQRDRAKENQFIQDLADCKLLPISTFYSDRDLNTKNRDSVLLGNINATSQDWLEFLSSPEAAILKERGWLINSDSKLGLTIHDILDFFPSIEADPDHGIDWFRFDVTGEFNGKRISFIPQIARAIAEDWLERYNSPETTPETLLLPCDNPSDGHIRFPAARFLEMLGQVRHLFLGSSSRKGPVSMDRLSAACVADSLAIHSSETTRALAALGNSLRDIQGLPLTPLPTSIKAELRPYQLDGFRWLQFLSEHSLHGVLADDMGLGKTLQTLSHLVALHEKNPNAPSLVIAPTSVVPNWSAEIEKFAPHLKVLVLHGTSRLELFEEIAHSDLVLTSYPLLVRDFPELEKHHWHALVLDEAQYIKNPKALTAYSACKLKANHRICLSGTPMENHLGELWSLMRFLMPGFLSDEKTFNTFLRKPIERDHSRDAQLALNRRVSPLILRRTKNQVATELPLKTTIIHGIDLNPKQTDLYESVRAAMDDRVRDAISTKGLAKSHIIVLDALLKLRQICCHPQLLKLEAAQRVLESAKLNFLTTELLPQLIEEGRRILLFSQFTSMLELIEEHLELEDIPYLKLTGQTKERAALVKKFQSENIPIFLISLKAGGTGLNLTAADTVIHYDPWWNPAAENQATDRAHRIGQTKPVFVHKLVCRGTIEDRILDLQNHKSALIEALLSEDTTKLKIDAETLSHLLAPLN